VDDGAAAELLAEIEKGQQLAGHFPDAEALDRAWRFLTGRITSAQADAELVTKYQAD
jgi:hypothetical protein